MDKLKQSSLLKRDRRIWIPYLILGVTLLITGISTVYVARSVRIRERFRFERAVQNTEDDIRNRLDTYTNLLRAGSGLFAATDQRVSRAQFRNFVERLELQQRYPGIQGIGFSIRVAPTEVDPLVQQLQQQGDSTFRIHPTYPRPEYHSILYLEPLDRRNQAAIGYDMFTEPTRRAAMAQARDTGLPAASGRVTLMQEIDRQKQAGFLIYVPIYRNGARPATIEERRALLQGFIYSPFRIDDLLQGILGETPDQYVDFAIYDSTDLSPDQLLHRSQRSSTHQQWEQAPFRTTRTLDVSGRTWTIVFASRPEIHQAAGHGIVLFVGFSGFVVSAVLFAVTRSQVRARIAAEQAAADLRQSESKYRRIVETSQEGIWLINAKGQTEFVNPYMADMLGYSTTEMIGRSLFEFMDKTAQTEAQLKLERRRQGIGELHDFRFQRRDGSEIWALVSTNPILNDQQEFVGALAMITDITARKRTEEALKFSEERFRKLTEKVRVIPWEAAPTGSMIYVGPQAVGILGYPLEAWYTEQFWKQHLHPDDRDWVMQFCLNSAQTEENYEFEYRMIAADGRIVWLYDLVSVVREDKTPKLLRGIMIDITDRKQAETERIELLNRAQKARTEAEVANRLKDEFLATLSHELRTPLNAMLGWTQLLRTRQFDEQTTQKALETIDRNTRLLNQLIADLLDVSRIMTGKFHLELRTISLAGVIQDAIAAVRSQAEAKEIQIKTQFAPTLPSIRGDYTRLQQIVWNLLTNAIKFTPAGGEVEIRLQSGTPLPDSPILPTVQLVVADTGQGIVPDFLPHIFERFRQADGTITRHHGGLGLGLAIVHHITTLHGGKIEADSPGQGKGTTFTVTLPLQPQASQELMQSEPPQIFATAAIASPALNVPSLNGLRILLVDDEADARSLLTTLLQEYGAEVTAVETAQAAYVVIQAAHPLPNLLISDIGMPDENGYMLIQRIRDLSPRPAGQVPAIALTAYARMEDQEQAIAAGFQMHVAKPIVPEDFVTTVAKLVGRYH